MGIPPSQEIAKIDQNPCEHEPWGAILAMKSTKSDGFQFGSKDRGRWRAGASNPLVFEQNTTVRSARFAQSEGVLHVRGPDRLGKQKVDAP